MEESTSVKVDIEVDNFSGLSRLDRPSASGVVGVALDVHDAVEVLVSHLDFHSNSVSQTIDHQLWPREVPGRNDHGRYRSCKGKRETRSYGVVRKKKYIGRDLVAGRKLFAVKNTPLTSPISN